MRTPAGVARPRLLPPGRRTARRQPRLPRRRAQTAQAQLPHAAQPRRGGHRARMTTVGAREPSITPMHRGQLPTCSCRQHRVDGLHRSSGRTASRNTPSTIMSPTRSNPGSRTEIRLGVRAHPTHTTNHAHAPPPARVDAEDSTDKEQRKRASRRTGESHTPGPGAGVVRRILTCFALLLALPRASRCGVSRASSRADRAARRSEPGSRHSPIHVSAARPRLAVRLVRNIRASSEGAGRDTTPADECAASDCCFEADAGPCTGEGARDRETVDQSSLSSTNPK